MELESTYEGDGWFRYKLRLPVDPFWAEAYISDLFIDFPGLQETAKTSQWSVGPSGDRVNCHHSGNDYQARPAEYVFRFRSSYRHFKRVPRGFSTFLSLTPQYWYFTRGDGTHVIYHPHMVGFTDHECMVPCPPSESDGSAPQHTMRFSLVPDVKILQLNRESSGITGLKYYLPYDASFVIEGSQNLTNWNAVAYGSSTTGTNDFNSASLITGGPFFRIQVLGINGHSLAAVQPTTANGLKSKPVKDVKIQKTEAGLAVTFPSLKSIGYQIDFTNAQGAVLKSFTYQAQSENSTFPIPQELQAGPIFVAVRPVASASQ